MAQAPTFIGLWDASRPFGTESRTESDDYHRNFAQTVQNSFGNVNGAVTSTHQDLNGVSGLAAAGTKPLPGVGGQTVVYFYLATPPPGYTPVNPDANVRTLMVGGAGATFGGTDDPQTTPVNTTVSVSLSSGATGSFTLTEADIPRINSIVTSVGSTYPFSDASSPNRINALPLLAVGPFGQVTPNAHSHSIESGAGSGTGTGTITPRYAMGVLGQLDV